MPRFLEAMMDEQTQPQFLHQQLIAASEEQILRMARRLSRGLLLRSLEEADIAQELRLWLWQKLRWFDPALGSWEAFASCRLREGVAALIAIQWQQKTRFHSNFMPLEERDFLSQSLARCCGQHQEQTDRELDCRHAISVLPTNDQELCQLLLRYSLTDAARQLQMPRATLVSAVHRLRRRWESSGLKEYLGS